jgi:hypothetical protein
MWNKDEHDFGDVNFNSTHCIRLYYTGEHELDDSKFSVSCGCTKAVYDIPTKSVYVCVNMNSRGEKTAYLSVNYSKEEQKIIKLKSNVI